MGGPAPQGQVLGFSSLERGGLCFIGAFACAILGVIGLTGTILAAIPGIPHGHTHNGVSTRGVSAGVTSPEGLRNFLIFAVVTVALFTLLLVLARRGRRILDNVEVSGLTEVTGPLPQLTAPATLDQVVAALNRLNGLGLPYTISFEPGKTAGAVTATVRWRVEEASWRNVFGAGEVKRTWVMRVYLLPNGRYAFGETSGMLRWNASLMTWSFHVSGSVARGKSMGGLHRSFIWSPGTGAQRLQIRSADAKMPVFTILRAYGWRPRMGDHWFARMWEY